MMDETTLTSLVREARQHVMPERKPADECGAKHVSDRHQPVAEILPFPLARRRRYIMKQAEVIAGMRTDVGERYLKRQLLTQSEALDRRGVACDLIDREVLALDSAIRAQLWRTILTPGCE